MNSETPPKLFSWIPKVSLIKHGFEAACINEFSGLKFDTKEEGDLATGKQVLDRLGFGDNSLKNAIMWQSRILIFNYLFTYQMLQKRKPKFQKLEDRSPKTFIDHAGEAEEGLGAPIDAGQETKIPVEAKTTVPTKAHKE